MPSLAASRSHGDADALDQFLNGRLVRSLKSAGSSLKICLIAEGEADLYPRLGRTMEWDIAAGHAVLAAAGGQIHALNGDVLSYGKRDLSNPHFYACSADYRLFQAFAQHCHPALNALSAGTHHFSV